MARVVTEVEIKLVAPGPGAVSPQILKIALLPGDIGIDCLLIDDSDDSVPAIQLLEGAEYLYELLDVPGHSTAALEPIEVFQPDSNSGLRGRLRPGLYTGTLPIALLINNEVRARSEVEIRSRKLSYRFEYRWMLRDIADQVTELVMERFAPSVRNFELDWGRDAATIYQRFAFLQSLLASDAFQAALAEIVRRPYVSWEDAAHSLKPGQAVRGDARLIRQFMRSGQRRESQLLGGISVPERLERSQREATSNNTPNQFVRYALDQWLQVLMDIDLALARCGSSPAISRGRREVAMTSARLEEVAGLDLFKDLDPLLRFPAENQVLQRREGYREVFKAFQEYELAARLSWTPEEDGYAAGQRDVARLYESWTFMQLAKIVSAVVGESFDLRPLVSRRADGLSVNLRSGVETAVSGTATRFGRTLRVELCFNRTFARSSPEYRSWTRPMRPDYSVVISPGPGEPAGFEPIAVHFDAKYRVEFVNDLFGGDQDLANAEVSSSVGRRVLRADLLKMHAYRDAIQRSAGAYVLYPGTGETRFAEYHELLPGLGAFPLRPTASGEASGCAAVQQFLEDVVSHVATRLTRHERGRYWLEESYAEYHVGSRLRPPILGAPKVDTTVLLGYVKSKEHWDWIHAVRSYNLRTEGRPGGVLLDSKLFAAQLVLLYCPALGLLKLGRIVSEPEAVSQVAMAATGYPAPRGSYFCVQLTWLSSQEALGHLTVKAIEDLVRARGWLDGEPTIVVWGDL